MPDRVYKQLSAVIDERTSIVCLNAAGQVRRIDQPFSTLNGDYDSPPFHQGCRSISLPFLLGSPDEQGAAASRELARRPASRSDARSRRLPPKPRGGRRGLSPKKRRRTQPKVPTAARVRRSTAPAVRRAPVKRRNTSRRRK